MIESVSAWVKGIVFIVLFAAFLELLLPSGGMQKFVRVIMGILIMIAVLNPVIDLLDKNPNSVQTMASPISQDDYAPPAGIADAANAAGVRRERLAREYYAKDLARQIRATVLSVGGVADAQVVVNLKDESNSKSENSKLRTPIPQVMRVVIMVEPEDATVTQAVKAVKINISPISSRENSGEELANRTAKKALNPLVKEKIERAVSQLYHIGLENIEVQPFFAG